LELTAVGLTLKAYENILYGLEIHVMSDNAVCVNINSFRPMNNREKRLIAYLQQFNLHFHYIKGRENLLADCLSRLPEDLDSQQVERLLPCEKPTEDDFILPLLSQAPLSVEQNVQNEPLEDISDEEKSANKNREWIVYTFDVVSNFTNKTPINATAAIFEPKTQEMRLEKQNEVVDRLQCENVSTQTNAMATEPEQDALQSTSHVAMQITQTNSDRTDEGMQFEDGVDYCEIFDNVAGVDSRETFIDRSGYEWTAGQAASCPVSQQASTDELGLQQHHLACAPLQVTSQAAVSQGISTETGDLQQQDDASSHANVPQPLRRSARLQARADACKVVSAKMQLPGESRIGQTQPTSAQLARTRPVQTDNATSQQQHATADNEDLSLKDASQQPTVPEILDKWATTEQEQNVLDNTEMAQQLRQLVDVPQIKPEDYLHDKDFAALYQFKTDGTLIGNDEVDRKTLLICDNYYLEGYVLFKMSLPRSVKQSRVRQTHQQLCVPAPFRSNIIDDYHRFLGHASHSRLYATLLINHHWPTMLKDIKDKLATCEICQKSKVSSRPSKAPLRGLPVPERPYQLVSFDHKQLTRTTDEGNNFILCVIDHFSQYITYCPVPNESAYVSAVTFVREIVSRWGKVDSIMSDKGAGYMSLFFQTISTLLGVRHITPAAMASRSNKCKKKLSSLKLRVRTT